VRHRLLWLLLIGILIAILMIVAQRGEGRIGPLSVDDFGSLAYRLAILVFLGAAVLTMFRERFTQTITAALLWVVVGLVLVIGYSYRFELGNVADRVMAELIPGHVIGVHVAMVLDTGASSVVLTQQDAKAIGLPLEVLNYTVSIDTANGRTRAAQVTLDRLAVGGLEERSVEALIVQPGQLRTSLLGMSFLNRLQSWQVSGDRLIMHGYP
jgi:aspartyl protease family protein